MLLAIPLFGPRVSPRFDHAQRLMLVTLEEGRVTSREEILMTPLASWQRVEQLKELGVDIVICGGIDKESACRLNEYRIRVVPLVSGEAMRALRDFKAGRIGPPCDHI
jgi:predicted Fe-Mo cluster-binding NifX family protein